MQMIARAAWRQDVLTAKALVKRNAMAAKLTSVIDGAVCLLSPTSFAEDFATAKVLQLASEFGPHPKARTPAHRAEAVTRKQQLWSSFGKTLFLTAVKCRDGPVVSDPSLI